ncbi:carbonic anhydrase [Methylocystis sp. SB2]|uniref:carbonic anhydrase n=1 Tax=Methylocystis sp. (strain SB2) TaxID=743836 RepID=UPI0004A2431D|nr:carbonic anhydrase [Methylocystis sp. SB2]KAF0119746.1 MAG: carbonic anhydrase [Methylocystaceae bacterium]
MCQACGFADIIHGSKMRRRAFVFGAAAAGVLTAVPSANAKAQKSQSKQTKKPSAPPKPENVLTPDEALARLMEGNKRYQQGLARRHDFFAEREALVGGQNPYAAILSCADSRIAPEYAFDSSRGDLFVVRVAGNVANPYNIASLEYAVEVLKTPLILVLCHEACGAVKSAISSIQDHTTLPGHLPSLVAALTPAVEAVRGRQGDLQENATVENARMCATTLETATPLLSAAVNEKRVKVVSGIYRLADGRVDLFA